MKLPYINIHSHRKAQIESEIVVRNAYLNVKPEFLVQTNYLLQCGLHPWFVKVDFEKLLLEKQSLFQNPKVFAIGEIGLDKVKKDNYELQLKAFQLQINIAKVLGKVSIIHCVKAYHDLEPILKSSETISILHDFNANEIITKSLLKNPKIYFSFGKLLFRNQQKAKELFEIIPINRIFFETDNMPILISEVYKKASEISGISELEFLQSTNLDFERIKPLQNK